MFHIALIVLFKKLYTKKGQRRIEWKLFTIGVKINLMKVKGTFSEMIDKIVDIVFIDGRIKVCEIVKATGMS